MELSTEEKILAAAKEVFTEKGYAAARMQEIANTAGINKGLLHYYFRNKSKLFRAIFEAAFTKFVPKINLIFESDLPLFEKIEAFVHHYMDVLIENPHIPAFVINELNQNQEAFVKSILGRHEKPNPMRFLMQIQAETEAGTIRQINPVNLMLNMISMCVFPFIAKPLLQGIIQVKDEHYMEIMELRKKSIVDFIVQSIKKE